MATREQLMQLIKLPVAVAAAVVVIRVILELAGATGWLPNIFGVAWLDILVPIYLGIKIAEAGMPKPLLELIKAMLMYAVVARGLVAVTYILAYVFGWSSNRFQAVIPSDATPLQGFITIPLTGMGFGLLSALLGAVVFGGLTLLIRRRTGQAQTAE